MNHLIIAEVKILVDHDVANINFGNCLECSVPVGVSLLGMKTF